VRRAEQGFDGFEEWRDKLWEEEDQQRHKLNRKIKAEARWAVEGISARRKRNQGRVRALADLRAEKASQIKRQGTAAMAFDGGSTSGKKVVEATGLTKSYDGKQIVRGFDITVQRGDRIAFVGPNGVGKTTVLNMLLGKVQPDEGQVKLGTKLDVAVFDQARAALDPNMTLWENLASDPVLGVSGKSDQIMVRGTPKHVVGYLKEFLFDEAQARAPVRSKGGKQAAPVARKTALSFTQKHRLEELPDVMEKLTAEIAKLEILLSDPDLFTQFPAKFQKASDALVARQTALQDAEEEWLMLEEKAGS